MLAVLFLQERPVCRGTESTNQFPSNEVVFERANPKMIWGEATNFLRGDRTGGKPLATSLRSAINVSNGVFVLSGHLLKVVDPAHLYIENCMGPLYRSPTRSDQGVPAFSVAASNVVWAYMPTLNERLALTLTDANGELVPKTPQGQALGQTPSLKPNTRWTDLPRAGTTRRGAFAIFPRQLFEMAFSDKIGAGIQIQPEETAKMFDFDPTNYFTILKPGLYKLEVIQRLYIEDTNRYLKAIDLPPVTADVRVDK
jgi:hypothetical protein